MTKLFRIFALLLPSLLSLSLIVGCGGDTEEEIETEGGDDVGWIGKVEGTKATLELIKGRELKKETTYVIKGEVSDATGDTINFRVTFVTKAKA